MPRPYKPQKKLNPGRRAWVKATFAEAVIYDDPDDSGDESIRLLVIRSPKIVVLNLTDYTVPELEAVKKVIDMAFKIATPIARERDKAAQEALINGDDSNTRTYRPLPYLVDRSGQERRNDPRLWRGSAGVPDDDDAGDGPDVRPEGSAVAEWEPVDVGTQDNGSEADGLAILCPADEVAD